MISDKFFEVKNESTNSEVFEICNIFKEWHDMIPKDIEIDCYEEYIDAYMAFESFLLSKSISFNPVEFVDDKRSNIDDCVKFFTEFNDHYEKKVTLETIEIARNKNRQRFKIGFAYEFTEGDLKRIQTLLNELRDLVTLSEDFDSNHRERILQRLEKVQSELHKRISSLDKFWGLVGDAGVVLGKFGKDAKPFVDRIREMTQIVWNTQTRAEELPSGTTIPLLSRNTNDEK